MSCYRLAVALWASVVIATSVSAQIRVRGSVTGGPSDRSSLAVELVDGVRHSPQDRTYVNTNGAFEIASVASGFYTIRVVTLNGSVLRSEQITVSQSMSDVALQLPDESTDGKAGGTISVRQLRHKPTAKARKLFAAAEKRSEAGDPKGAIVKLREAIALDPEYMEAHNNLGCKFMNLRQTGPAIESFQRAIDLDPRAPFAYANLAAALLTARRPAEAEMAARQAIQNEGGISKTRYLLGLSLVHQRKYTREAAQSLRQAEEDFPDARLAAAAVLESLGEVKEAKAELKTYLNVGPPQKHVEVKAWLSRLQ